MALKLTDVPTWDQVNTLLESMRRDYAAIGPRNFLAVAMLATTGVRSSELLAIRKCDVRPDGTVVIRQLKRGEGVHREVLVVPWLRPLLEKYLQNLGEQDRLFPFTRQQLLKLVYALTKKYLGKRFRSHAFRHAFATRILERTRDVALCKRLLGHTNVNTTMTYLDFTAKDRASEIYDAVGGQSNA